MIGKGRRQVVSFGVIALVSLLYTSHTIGGTGPAITGDIVETYCWAKMSVAGVGHAACGIECAKRGIPVAIVDARTRTAYILLPGRDKQTLPANLIAAMGRRVTIQGETLTRGGANFLTVQSWTHAR